MDRNRLGIIVFAGASVLVGIVWLGIVVKELLNNTSGDYSRLAVPLIILALGVMNLAFTIPRKRR
jgi:hypothetical protein